MRGRGVRLLEVLEEGVRVRVRGRWVMGGGSST